MFCGGDTWRPRRPGIQETPPLREESVQLGEAVPVPVHFFTLIVLPVVQPPYKVNLDALGIDPEKPIMILRLHLNIVYV